MESGPLSRSGDFMKQLKSSKRPVILTVKGKAAAIVQDAEAYQHLLDIAARADVREGIRQGLEEARQGKGRDIKEFFASAETLRISVSSCDGSDADARSSPLRVLTTGANM